MSEIISLQQSIYDKATFSRVVNTQFTELNTPQPTVVGVTVDEFFQLYEDLFFDIPKDGEVNSHNYILNKEAEYLGIDLANDVDIQALLQEITDLRQQLLQVETDAAKGTVSAIAQTLNQ
jgi:hypothetical protein